MKITCGGCDNTWTSLRAAHCSVCHRTFGGIRGFDTHRTGGTCHNPEEFGYHEINGTWHKPIDPEVLAQLRAARTNEQDEQHDTAVVGNLQ